jgi:hypothetical protein
LGRANAKTKAKNPGPPEKVIKHQAIVDSACNKARFLL